MDMDIKELTLTMEQMDFLIWALSKNILGSRLEGPIWVKDEELGVFYVEDKNLGVQVLENQTDYSIKITTW